MENVLTLDKIVNLLSYIQNISSNELARPVMGTIFLVILKGEAIM